jgi:type IV pilus assembly protein PilE
VDVSRGFSLLELLVVLCILAILIGIALPSYQASVIKGRRSDAMALLLEVAGRQERHRFRSGRYSDDLLALGYAQDPLPSEGGHYRLSVGACPDTGFATCYRLNAEPDPASPQADDARCATLSLDAYGQRRASGSHPASCW